MTAQSDEHPDPGVSEPRVQRVRRSRFVRIALRAGLCVLAIGVVVGIATAISHAHELSVRLQCQRNMKAIGTAMRYYGLRPASDGHLAPNPVLLLKNLTPEQLLCSSSGVATSNYVLATKLDRDDSPGDNSTVVVYEPVSNHGGDGGNVLFADGHAQFVPADRFDQVVGGGSSLGRDAGH